MEAMIARCLDSDPDKRPSARELVDFMLQLPQQLSLEGSTSCSDWSSRESPTHQQEALKPTHGVALPISISRLLDSRLPSWHQWTHCSRCCLKVIASCFDWSLVSPKRPRAYGRVRAEFWACAHLRLCRFCLYTRPLNAC